MAKYACYVKPKIYCNINQKLAKSLILYSAEAYPEPFQTSKQGGYLFGGNYFHKKLHLRCLARFWICYCPVNHKNNQTNKAKTHNMATLRQGTSVYLITGKPLKELLNGI